MPTISPATIPSDIMAEAAIWLARLHADDRTDSDEHRFRAWLAADLRRGVAFERVTDIWTLAGNAAHYSGAILRTGK